MLLYITGAFHLNIENCCYFKIEQKLNYNVLYVTVAFPIKVQICCTFKCIQKLKCTDCMLMEPSLSQ